MSISLRGEAHKTEAGLRSPLFACRSGAIRWGFLAVLACGMMSANQAKAQLTAKVLLNKSISDPTDEKYPDVVDAIKYFTNRDAKAALNSLKAAKAADPKLPPADMMLAEMWRMANQAGPLRGALEECVKNNPDDPEAYLVLADLAFNDRQVAAAELLFSKAEQLAATFKGNGKRALDFQGRAEAGLAAVAESREQWDTAKTFLQNWLKIVDPTGAKPVPGGEPNTAAANAHDRLGRVLFHADPDPKKAAGARQAHDQFLLAVDDDPKSISADIALAQLYEDAKMHDMAKVGIKHAVSHLPEDPATKLATLIAAAGWALDTNQANEAFTYAQDALSLEPKGKRALEAKFLMGVAARMKGDTKTAEQELEEVVAASPGNFRASNQLAQVLAEQKNDTDKQERGLEIASLNQAAATANNGAQRDPGKAIEAAATLGWVFYEMDRIPEADQVTQAIANTGAASPDILYYRARLLQDPHGQTKDAIASLRAALSNARGFFIHRQDAEDLLAKLDKSYKPGSAVSSSPPATTPLPTDSDKNAPPATSTDRTPSK